MSTRAHRATKKRPRDAVRHRGPARDGPGAVGLSHTGGGPLMPVAAALLAAFAVARTEATPVLQWTFHAQAEVVSSPCLVDLDGDGLTEVVFGSYDSNVYVLNGSDGSHVYPWPRSTGPGTKVYGSPAVADLDGDGMMEIVVGCEDTNGSPWGWVHVWSADGSLYPGWPQPVGTVVVSPAIGDLDGDSVPDIVVSSGMIFAFRRDGTLLPGQWPVDTGSSVRSSPALGDVDGDGLPEVAIGTDHACVVHVLNADGSEVPGWPYSTEEKQLCYIPGSPALGDLDGDGLPEVVFGSDTHGIYAVDGDGTDLEGWPVWAGYWVASSPALADFQNDHHLETVIGSADGHLYVLRDDGSALPGWPQSTVSEVLSNPALGDIDGDGDLDIVVGTFGFTGSRIVAFDGSGAELWELPVGGNLVSSPAIGDVDADGHLELLIGCRELSALYCYDLGPGSFDPDYLPWPMFHRDRCHTGLYPDLGPVVEVLAPNGGEMWSGVQTILWQAWGDGLQVDIAWSQDTGQLWNGLVWGHPNTGTYAWNTTTVPDGSAYLIRVEAYGEGLSGWDQSDATFTVKNHAEPLVELLYPIGGEVLTGLEDVQWRAEDADGDTLIIDLLCRTNATSLWQVVATDLPNTGSFSWQTASWPDGDTFLMRARAFDGLYWSEDTSAAFTIYNPDPPEVELLFPNGGEYLQGSVTVLYQATDPDGEELAAHAECSPGGMEWLPIAIGMPNTGEIPWQTDSFPNSDAYLLRVGASDSHWTVWDTCDAPFVVHNNHPPVVWFESPAQGDTVSGDATIRWSADDPEGDPLTFWLRTGREDAAWDTLVAGSADTSFLWNTLTVLDGPWQLRLRAADPETLWSEEATVDVWTDNLWTPTITLLHPLGGETVSGPDTIRWAASDPDSQALTADVALARADSAWTLGQSVESDRLPWDTSLYPDGWGYVVSVTIRDEDGLESEASSDGFGIDNPHPPIARLLWPTGGEVLTGNVTVLWQASDPDSDDLLIGLLLRSDAGAPWTSIADQLANTGSYLWDTRAWPDGSTYGLKLEAGDGGAWASDSTASPFTISNPVGPTVQVLYPNGGEILQGIVTVQWSASSPQEDTLEVDLEVSGDGGQTWLPITSGEANDGASDWDTADLPNGSGYLIQIAVRGVSGTASDQSDAPFAIENAHPPTITILRPQKDETVTGRYPIKWVAQDVDGDTLSIDIQLSTGAEQAWASVATAIQNWGVHVWDTAETGWSPGARLRLTAWDGVFAVACTSDVFVLTNARQGLDDVVVYPNPCFTVGPRRGPVIFQNLTPSATIAIRDVAGRCCRTIAERDGDGRAEWDLLTEAGRPCAAGLFFYEIQSSSGQARRGRIVLAR
jgi:hypothetical protein